MKEQSLLGWSPAGETCDSTKEEAQRWKALLERLFPNPPPGSYFDVVNRDEVWEVILFFNPEIEGFQYAEIVESWAPILYSEAPSEPYDWTTFCGKLYQPPESSEGDNKMEIGE